MLELATLEKIVCVCVSLCLKYYTNQNCDGVKVEEGKEEELLKSRMLTMAGLFDICNSPHYEVVLSNNCLHSIIILQDAPLFTYTVITVAANDHFGAIHHRMPVR